MEGQPLSKRMAGRTLLTAHPRVPELRQTRRHRGCPVQRVLPRLRSITAPLCPVLGLPFEARSADS